MPQPTQQQKPPGVETQMAPKPDHGEQSYQGCGRLVGKAAVITGGDSGIGRAVAIAYAREGADVLVSYLNEEEDAQETRRWVERAGRRCVLAAGDIRDPAHCRAIIDRAVDEFGRVDILVNNAAFQMTRESLEEIPDEEWIYTFDVNIHPQFFLAKAALKHMKPGSSIINTTSVNSDKAPPKLIAYSATKAAIANFTASLGQSLADRGIRVNCVAPGPIWTPLIPATMPPQQVESFGQEVPMKRPGQPKEVATLFVFLASDDASYVTGARYAVTGGTPIL
ncbi:glucose 1-dehydrogenase [Ramlibacter tataouinensis]|uniref:Dehydrogenases with different specificities (Related to short-chain alcohol dehydrogenases)-like protein n=1 Tax=Ramlibacter tataouinensis (strain ATCC BAA-407 / DSM 14655 / LMG 21543 / TTB310) TaxID=365046 RepID=F5Y0Y3_RAMTT|nr:glucose 1-dehydrogenase [Ramlibacter tataouinensis]AEG92201.1 dehydrogenases with different specificities (related to short-chain alcohol dehydrogenases)-like protein [Ramlibacter tataouinensis TTB310]